MICSIYLWNFSLINDHTCQHWSKEEADLNCRCGMESLVWQTLLSLLFRYSFFYTLIYCSSWKSTKYNGRRWRWLWLLGRWLRRCIFIPDPSRPILVHFDTIMPLFLQLLAKIMKIPWHLVNKILFLTTGWGTVT